LPRCSSTRRGRRKAGDDLAEPFPGVRERHVPALPQPFFDLPQLGAYAVRARLPFDLKIAAPRFAADQHEAQECEGFRFADPVS
jgi:hypothetical protein